MGERSLQPDEPLVIPILSLHVIRNFSDLAGKPMRYPRWETSAITVAVQGIRFRLDEQGAILESYAELEEELGILPETQRKRHFVFDKPFRGASLGSTRPRMADSQGRSLEQPGLRDSGAIARRIARFAARGVVPRREAAGETMTASS